VPAHQLLVNFMKIPPVTAYQLLASGTSNEQVFQTAASTLTPAQLEAALPGMAKFVASQFPVANYDTKLQPYLQIPGSPAAPARAGPP